MSSARQLISICSGFGLPEMIVQTAVECVCYGMQMTILVATWVALGHRQTWSLPSVLALVSIGICSTLAIIILATDRTRSARTSTVCKYGAGVVSGVDPLALMATRCNDRLGLYKLRMLVWLGPMICANALSTALIGRRVWTYRRNIRGSLGRLTGQTSIIYLVVVVNIDSDPLLHIQGLDTIIDTAYRSFAVRHIGGPRLRPETKELRSTQVARAMRLADPQGARAGSALEDMGDERGAERRG
ncbi:hypothetical protein FB107DRAFT_248848 [Schizophyllum commune]